jgi:hypothetical protein
MGESVATKKGRPSKYCDELVEKAYHYIDNYGDYGDLIPSHAGMAVVLDISKSTLYDWADDPEKAFSDILGKCNQKQEKTLLNGGLGGEFNAAITKLALGKQGYSDKTETDTQVTIMTHEQWLDTLE